MSAAKHTLLMVDLGLMVLASWTAFMAEFLRSFQSTCVSLKKRKAGQTDDTAPSSWIFIYWLLDSNKVSVSWSNEEKRTKTEDISKKDERLHQAAVAPEGDVDL